MPYIAIVKEGAFDADIRNAINTMFAALFSGGGTLPGLAATDIWVGSAGGVATAVPVSGDATLASSGALTVVGVNGSATTKTGAQINTMPVGVAAGYKIARSITALGGSNPTTIVTGLATITGVGLALNRTTSLASGTAFVTYNLNATPGSLDVYAWVVAGTASSGTENVAWVAVGT